MGLVTIDDLGSAGPTPVHQARLTLAQESTHAVEMTALLVTPGPNLRYLTGYDAVPLERLTCLVLPAEGSPTLIVPELEIQAALDSPVGELGLTALGWSETDDPYALVASLLPTTGVLGLDDGMTAAKVLALRSAIPNAEQTLAGPVLHRLRAVKSAQEIKALQDAADAIDRVHEHVPGLLRAGRTEREIGRDIAEMILEAGHDAVDFVIVASGPNAASPHHEQSDRMVVEGDVVVVDIGGTMPSGYCSDCTRTYSVGRPPDEFAVYFGALQRAQAAAVASVRPGVTAESVDAAARDLLIEAGYGNRFIHRTGHGIGLETHEEPYIVQGNSEQLVPGMVFSIEPGVYLPGLHGARIEDIVVVTDHDVRSLNQCPRELVVIETSFSA